MIDVDNFAGRVIQDAMTEALASYWLRRAEAFENARPRPSDFTGNATPDQLAARDERCAQIAAACRHRASVSEFNDELIDQALQEVA